MVEKSKYANACFSLPPREGDFHLHATLSYSNTANDNLRTNRIIKITLDFVCFQVLWAVKLTTYSVSVSSCSWGSIKNLHWQVWYNLFTVSARHYKLTDLTFVNGLNPTRGSYHKLSVVPPEGDWCWPWVSERGTNSLFIGTYVFAATKLEYAKFSNTQGMSKIYEKYEIGRISPSTLTNIERYETYLMPVLWRVTFNMRLFLRSSQSNKVSLHRRRGFWKRVHNISSWSTLSLPHTTLPSWQ